MYYLTIKAKRKDAKKHIAKKGHSISELAAFGYNNLNNKYIVEIFDAKWNFVMSVK